MFSLILLPPSARHARSDALPGQSTAISSAEAVALAHSLWSSITIVLVAISYMCVYVHGRYTKKLRMILKVPIIRL